MLEVAKRVRHIAPQGNIVMLCALIYVDKTDQDKSAPDSSSPPLLPSRLEWLQAEFAWAWGCGSFHVGSC
jgi:hypothetical protein